VRRAGAGVGAATPHGVAAAVCSNSNVMTANSITPSTLPSHRHFSWSFFGSQKSRAGLRIAAGTANLSWANVGGGCFGLYPPPTEGSLEKGAIAGIMQMNE
jgi:hypothetical protein